MAEHYELVVPTPDEVSTIYLASPYSDESEWVRNERHNKAEYVVAQLMKRGYMVFSPIVHCHTVALNYGLPGKFEFWQTYNTAMITAMKSFGILMLPGYIESTGVSAERGIAEKQEKPQYLVTLDDGAFWWSKEPVIHRLPWSAALEES